MSKMVLPKYKLNVCILESQHKFVTPKTAFDKLKLNYAELFQLRSYTIIGKEKQLPQTILNMTLN